MSNIKMSDLRKLDKKIKYGIPKQNKLNSEKARLIIQS